MGILQLAPGQLAAVPNFSCLATRITDGSAKDTITAVEETCKNLGRAVQLGQHRHLIETLNSVLANSDLADVTALALNDSELCAALSVNFTTLEQAYHWPREDNVTTPEALQDYKLVIQILGHPELRDMLDDFTEKLLLSRPVHYELIVSSALTMAEQMIKEAEAARNHTGGPGLSMVEQDRLNLLYRTCREDWFIQGCYLDVSSHREFGRLHETMRTNGTQRRCQEIFEETGGLSWLQRMPELLNNLPASSVVVCHALQDLQISVALVRDELFFMMIDETIWGRTFARWSKSIGVNNIGAGGADCPLFKMLDALIGRSDPLGQADLLDELDFRSRHFPPNMKSLIHAVASAPSIRAYVDSTHVPAEYHLKEAFKGLQQLMYEMYEMHRKKAMRIALALRSGQTKTSSGIEKAGSPELHISNSMKAAMEVRFGDDVERLKIDAYAWSSPLLYGDDGKIETARTRFVLSTPLAVLPGDNVSVSIPMSLKDGSTDTRTRTYSITHTDTQWWKPSAGCCQITSFLEVCVRNQGEVSSFLCNQRSGFPVRVSVKAASHFRIQPNIGFEDETIFVGQGGAVGVFIAWLSSQTTFTGRYRLVIGARNYAAFPYSSHLLQLATNLAPSLQIVVCFSDPSLGDIEKLQPDLKSFQGRVTEYLKLPDSASQRGIWYVCGSAAFDMDCVKAINGLRSQKNRSSDIKLDTKDCESRLWPIITSKLPAIRLHAAPGHLPTGPVVSPTQEEQLPTERCISRTRLSLHNSPKSLWIALEDRVFDITSVPSFHPGGEKVLMYRAGRQAMDVFETVHNDSFEVVSLLEKTFIGYLAPPHPEQEYRDWEFLVDKMVETQNDLTNQSRFEQVPTGCVDQLAQAPPVAVISKSIAQFITVWSGLLREAETRSLPCQPANAETLVSRLNAALQGTNVRLDALLKNVFKKSFQDVATCAEVQRDVFQSYVIVAGKLHAAIDRMKESVFTCLTSGSVPHPALWTRASSEIAEALETITIPEAQ